MAMSREQASDSRAPATALEQAIAAYARDDLVTAERLCCAVVAADAQRFEAVYLAAVIKSRRGDLVAALADYDKALALRPHFAEAHDNRGLLLQDMGDAQAALASHDAALALEPRRADAWFNRGVALQTLGRIEEALGSYEQTLARAPGDARALHNRGVVLGLMGRYAEALASYDAALALAPERAETHANRGNTLNLMKRHAEALASFDAALLIAPRDADALNGQGLALHEEGRFDAALAALNAAIAIRPDFAEAHHNRARTLTALRRIGEALADYGRAQALRPNYARAHHDEALCRLLIGDLPRGFEAYEWRWETEALRSWRRLCDAPLWLGREPVAGRTVLVHAEQGLGDTIMFCRYVPLLAARGARVLLEVQPPLKNLLTGIAGATEVLAPGERLPPFDLHCPVMSLPLAFGTTAETIPPPCRLPPPPAAIVETWRDRLREQLDGRLGKPRRPRIGVAWSGNPAHGNDRNRSVPLTALMPLLRLPADVVSLQREVRPNDRAALDGAAGRIAHFDGTLADFQDTAALVSLTDVVVCVDTSIAHLSATLGRPTVIMLPANPDWRWQLDRDDSPWYPAARLVRQRRHGDWHDVIDRVLKEVRGLI
jgi:tetratricopeptide (TPR) repeat protein